MKKFEIKKIISEIVTEVMYEGALPTGLSPSAIIPIEKFVQRANTVDEASDMLGASTSTLSPEEMQDYLSRVKNKKQLPTDKYKMPFVHGSNVEIKDEANRTFDLEKLRNAISSRPAKLLKQNEKITHSGGDSTVYFNIGLPALKGLAVNEKTGDFVVVDTCPGAGACKVYCYAKKGGYVQWKASSMSQTRTLNYLLNDPAGFKTQLTNEIKSEERKYEKKNTKIVIRWHDAGDFFSDEYLQLAYGIAKTFPNIDFYAYTKMAGVAMGSKPDNFRVNFSGGATPDQEKQVDFTTTKHSTVVPKPMFDQHILKDESGKAVKDADGRTQWKSPKDLEEFKKKLSAKHSLDPNTVITYDEMMKIPVGTDKKWNVIVKTGDGDDSANRPDVLGTYLLIH